MSECSWNIEQGVCEVDEFATPISEEQPKLMGRRALVSSRAVVKRLNRETSGGNRALSFILLGLWLTLPGLSGCGQTAQPVTSPTAGQVDSYFGGPFNIPSLDQSSSTIDHAANTVGISFYAPNQGTLIPKELMYGSFAAANTGFLGITEDFSGSLPVNPPTTGAWAVEIPGAGVLANFLNLSSGSSVSAGPAAMAENSACPDFSSQTPFLYVTVPQPSGTGNPADYGKVSISVQGSDVTFSSTPFKLGAVAQTPTTVTGGCSISNLGAVMAYPMNTFGSPGTEDLISVGASSFLVSSFVNQNLSPATGVFGGRAGVVGVVQPSAPVGVSAVLGAKYNGFVYTPQNQVQEKNYDITELASSFGDDSATSQACSALQASLSANNGQGAMTVPVLPSANSLYGGEYLTVSGAGAVNDPTGASGSENCDLVIDLGTQDSSTNGLFPNATVFIGSSFPPNSATTPWTCPGTADCATSFPAAAIVGQVKGQYVIFVTAIAPAGQLPGNQFAQPVGIYLFQKSK
jgi:hypothetical protein